MLGRWQPFHEGHYALFEEVIKKTGQACIQVRDAQGIDGNPFDFEYVKSKIKEKLELKYKNRFKIILVPNITNICYNKILFANRRNKNGNKDKEKDERNYRCRA